MIAHVFNTFLYVAIYLRALTLGVPKFQGDLSTKGLYITCDLSETQSESLSHTLSQIIFGFGSYEATRGFAVAWVMSPTQVNANKKGISLIVRVRCER